MKTYVLLQFEHKNVIGQRYSQNKRFIMYWMSAAKYGVACRNTSQIVEPKYASIVASTGFPVMV